MTVHLVSGVPGERTTCCCDKEFAVLPTGDRVTTGPLWDCGLTNPFMDAALRVWNGLKGFARAALRLKERSE